MKAKVFGLERGTFVAALLALPFIATIPSGATDAPLSPPKRTGFIYVSGEVKIPQRYVYTNGMTLGSAIKLAKGPTAFASQKVLLTRNGGQPQTVDRKTIEQGKAKDIELQPGDKLFVARRQ